MSGREVTNFNIYTATEEEWKAMNTPETKLIVPALPRGFVVEGCSIATAWHGSRQRNGVLFIKDPGGAVYHNGRYPLDLTDDRVTNAADRGAYAKLAGVTVKSINEARKAAKAESQKRRDKREVDSLKKSARRVGYKLVKVKSPKA